MDSKIFERARWARMRGVDAGEGEAVAGSPGAVAEEKPTQTKTLTQEEVNKLVQTRLARGREKLKRALGEA